MEEASLRLQIRLKLIDLAAAMARERYSPGDSPDYTKVEKDRMYYIPTNVKAI